MTKKDVYNFVDELKEHKAELNQILKENGYTDGYDKFIKLIQAIKGMYILNPNRQHTFAEFDEFGYIESAIDFICSDIVFDQGVFPEDLLDGYYKLENGNIVRDEARKEELYTLD